MINAVMSVLVNELGQYLKNRYSLTEDPVMSANLTALDGSVAVGGENKIVLTLVNIENETVIPKSILQSDGGGNRILSSPPPVYLNLNVLLSAYFQNTNYLESLKFLSASIMFFQRNQVMTKDKFHALSGHVGKLTIEIVNLSLNELGNLWGQLGGKYLPSIMYKVRMIPFNGEYPVSIDYEVTDNNTGAVLK